MGGTAKRSLTVEFQDRRFVKTNPIWDRPTMKNQNEPKLIGTKNRHFEPFRVRNLIKLSPARRDVLILTSDFRFLSPSKTQDVFTKQSQLIYKIHIVLNVQYTTP
jgi:hypothetical protein